MRVHRNRLRGLAALLGSLVVTAVGTAVFLQPASPASAQTLEPSAFDSQAMESGTVMFRADGDSAGAGTDSFSGPPTVIWCRYDVFDPHVAPGALTRVTVHALAQCTWPVPSISAAVSLFRGDNEVSTKAATGFGTGLALTTSGPCQGGAYFAAGTATIFPPPGYSPPFRVFNRVSNIVPINGAGTAVPPHICKQGSTPPPPPPPPSGLPVVNSMFCEYLGNNRFNCHLSASNWTQIRWTFNGSARSAWNDQVNVMGTCSGGVPLLKASVSNANGTVTTQDTFRCEGQPL
jgi:hypothetical protein